MVDSLRSRVNISLEDLTRLREVYSLTYSCNAQVTKDSLRSALSVHGSLVSQVGGGLPKCFGDNVLKVLESDSDALHTALHRELKAMDNAQTTLHGAHNALHVPQLRLCDYVKIMQIGQGAYGDVWLADDIQRDRLVALKKLKLGEEREGVSVYVVRKRDIAVFFQFPKNSIREISLLRMLPPLRRDPLERQNSVGGLESAYKSGVVLNVEKGPIVTTPAKGSVWMVFEYLPFDLNGTIEQLREQEGQLTIPEVKRIVYDILKALEFCHSKNVIHRDLKSANLLISAEGRVKVADFGLARPFDSNTLPLTNRVITFWYRPPELLLGVEWYTPSVDIWSAGCIFAELITNKAIFGADREATVLKVIAETLGPPSELEWPGRTSLPLWNNVEANPLLTMPSTEMSVTCPRLSGSARTDLFAASPTKLGGREVHAVWSRLTERLGPVGVNLLKSMLRYNPKDRISAANALRHPWFSNDSVLEGYCHAYALRKDRERQKQKAAQFSAGAGGANAVKRTRILSNCDFLERMRRVNQQAAASNAAQRSAPTLAAPTAVGQKQDAAASDRRAESPSYSRRRSFPDQLASESNDLSKIKLSEQSQNVNVSVTCNTTLPSSGSASGADQTGVHKSNAAVGGILGKGPSTEFLTSSRINNVDLRTSPCKALATQKPGSNTELLSKAKSCLQPIPPHRTMSSSCRASVMNHLSVPPPPPPLPAAVRRVCAGAAMPTIPPPPPVLHRPVPLSNYLSEYPSASQHLTTGVCGPKIKPVSAASWRPPSRCSELSADHVLSPAPRGAIFSSPSSSFFDTTTQPSPELRRLPLLPPPPPPQNSVSASGLVAHVFSAVSTSAPSLVYSTCSDTASYAPSADGRPPRVTAPKSNGAYSPSTLPQPSVSASLPKDSTLPMQFVPVPTDDSMEIELEDERALTAVTATVPAAPLQPPTPPPPPPTEAARTPLRKRKADAYFSNGSKNIAVPKSGPSAGQAAEASLSPSPLQESLAESLDGAASATAPSVGRSQNLKTAPEPAPQCFEGSASKNGERSRSKSEGELTDTDSSWCRKVRTQHFHLERGALDQNLALNSPAGHRHKRVCVKSTAPRDSDTSMSPSAYTVVLSKPPLEARGTENATEVGSVRSDYPVRYRSFEPAEERYVSGPRYPARRSEHAGVLRDSSHSNKHRFSMASSGEYDRGFREPVATSVSGGGREPESSIANRSVSPPVRELSRSRYSRRVYSHETEAFAAARHARRRSGSGNHVSRSSNTFLSPEPYASSPRWKYPRASTVQTFTTGANHYSSASVYVAQSPTLSAADQEIRHRRGHCRSSSYHESNYSVSRETLYYQDQSEISERCHIVKEKSQRASSPERRSALPYATEHPPPYFHGESSRSTYSSFSSSFESRGQRAYRSPPGNHHQRGDYSHEVHSPRLRARDVRCQARYTGGRRNEHLSSNTRMYDSHEASFHYPSSPSSSSSGFPLRQPPTHSGKSYNKQCSSRYARHDGDAPVSELVPPQRGGTNALVNENVEDKSRFRIINSPSVQGYRK